MAVPWAEPASLLVAGRRRPAVGLSQVPYLSPHVPYLSAITNNEPTRTIPDCGDRRSPRPRWCTPPTPITINPTAAHPIVRFDNSGYGRSRADRWRSADRGQVQSCGH